MNLNDVYVLGQDLCEHAFLVGNQGCQGLCGNGAYKKIFKRINTAAALLYFAKVVVDLTDVAVPAPSVCLVDMCHELPWPV